VIPGIGGADLSAAPETSFELETELTASFTSSRAWIDHEEMTVLYDPTQTQIQWWRQITPRVLYAQVVQFNVCGVRSNTHDLFVSDLTASKLVLACEPASLDTVCHAVEPTTETIGPACDPHLIDRESERGRQCLARAEGEE
jgi:hypothetical protein